MIRFLFCLVFLVSTASAQEYRGGSFLAATAPSFPCRTALKFLGKFDYPYMSVLPYTFGRSFRCVQKFVRRNDNHLLQFYLSNEVCRRNGNCYPHELASSLNVREYNRAVCSQRAPVVNAIRRRLQKLRALCEGANCILALGLESQFNVCATRQLIALAEAEGWPRDQLVLNQVAHTNRFPNLDIGFREFHGVRFKDSRSRVVGSLDGTPADFCELDAGVYRNRVTTHQLRKWVREGVRRSAPLAAWCPSWQGLRGNSNVAPDPRVRSYRLPAEALNKYLNLMR